VLNRAVGRATLFAKAADYEAFVRVLSEALDWVEIRLPAYCVMPNHWHLWFGRSATAISPKSCVV
jgi:putative transposase